MKEITVRYLLSDEEEERLKKITQAANKVPSVTGPFTEESMFEAIMCVGSKFDIEKKFGFWESNFGIEEKENANN